MAESNKVFILIAEIKKNQNNNIDTLYNLVVLANSKRLCKIIYFIRTTHTI